ncbi:hypothetical protein [Cupriavidus malaysiensis]|uniref:Knr4/Smi1-like domain-containing protein n=1 Tax=Cupriavidus malaysiensis TaxID=367825 RepID=A0ABM6FGL2_9BURK|nr:hypothetical protein [Cupriavidus malaysiensis]AOZ11085.1 hypothetical protein BKK80_34560 [Cupriavidus malaysiensis]
MDSDLFMQKRDRIRDELKKAFPLVPIPASHRRADDVVHPEVDEDVQKFLGRPWDHVHLEDWIRSVSPAAIRRGTSNAFFKYYLPSLLHTVFDDMGYAYLALDAVLPDNPGFEPRPDWKVFRQSFQPIQAEAVASFLEFIREETDPNGPDWFGADAGLSGLWN